jgi:hypothetical protein
MIRNTFFRLLFMVLVFICLIVTINAYGMSVVVPDIPGGNHPIPQYKLNINIITSKTEINRFEEFNLTYQFYNDKEINNNNSIPETKYIDYLNDDFCVVDKKNNSYTYGEFSFVIKKLNGSENWNKSLIIINKGASNGRKMLFDSLRRNTMQLVTKQGNRINYVLPLKKYIDYYHSQKDNIELNITNNIPVINNAEVFMLSSKLIADNELIYWDIDKPVVAKFSVLGKDLEDNNNLTYNLSVEINDSDPNGGAFSKHELSNYRENLFNTSWILESGSNYSFYATAIDKEGGISQKATASIRTKDKRTYWKFQIPSWEDYYLPAILSFFLTMITLITLIILSKIQFACPKSLTKMHTKIHNNICKIKECSPSATNTFILFVLASMVYLFFILYLNNIDIWGTKIYFRSIAFWVLYIYTIIFILFKYFIEACFYRDETIPNTSKPTIWIINIIIMTFGLWFFYVTISQINKQNFDDYLFRYYSTIVQVSGTLLAIILGVNIVADGMDRRKKPESNYVKSVRYMVILYGILIGLSLYGLFAGTISFAPIIDASIESLPIRFSILIFESTLLLIPPAITSLFLLFNAEMIKKPQES